ncbi:right-handed parallel beta-helix repeat-containing protein [Candidatus Bipolaricaulota bacterium]
MRRALLVASIIVLCFSVFVLCDSDDDAMHDGGARLEALQNNDGGWDWPLDDGNPANASPLNTIGPIAMGLARGYWNSGDVSFQTKLSNTGALLLTKLNNFSPSDGYLATILDSVFGGSAYRDHVQANFYGPLAAGTYDRKGEGTLYDTAAYVQKTRDDRASQGIANLAAWDIGMGLVGAAAASGDLAPWIAGVKAEIDELTSSGYYDVIGLAGAIYGLASVGEDHDPTAGEHAAANSLIDLANILASYQISTTGGFTWNASWMGEYSDEAVQETAYAVLALNEVDRMGYLAAIADAADWLVDVQLLTGGWEQYPYYHAYGENNALTGEAMWGIHAVYVQDVWVDENGDDHAFGFGYLPFETLAEAVAKIGGTNGTVHIGDGTFTLGPGTYITRLFIEGNAIVSGVGSTTLQAPGSTSVTLAESSKTWDPIVFAYGGTMDAAGAVTGAGTIQAQISGFEIDGQNSAVNGKRFVGILLRNVGGEVSGNNLQNLYDADGKGNGPETFGILVYGDSAIDILNNTITDYSRGGIGVQGDLGDAPDPVATVQGNTLTGNGFEGETGWWADNGIQFGYGASGQIVGNTITGHWSNSPWGASGIIIASTANVDIIQNLVQNNELGIALAGYSVYGAPYEATENVLVSENEITANEYGISLQMDANNTLILLNNVTGNTVGISVADYYGFEAVGTEIHYNSITGNVLGVENWEVDADIDASANWWGSLDGPTADIDGDGSADYAGGGDEIYGDVIFSPWLGSAPDGDPGQWGVQITAPMLIIVDDVGPEPAAGYLNAAIAASNSPDLAFADIIEVRHGTYDASEPITDGVTIVSEVGSTTNTFLNGSILIDTVDVLIGRIGEGFTINGPIGVGGGVDASTIHINWNDIYGVVTNEGTRVLDATFNYWDIDGPNTVGRVHIYPLLPLPAADVIGYMDEHGFSVMEAITFTRLLSKGRPVGWSKVATELYSAFGIEPDESMALIREYGLGAVKRALRRASNLEEFLVGLMGYITGDGGGGGGGADGISSFCVGCPVPLELQLIHPITGEPITDACVSYSVCQTLPDGTANIVAFGVMTYDGDFGAYVFELDTTGYEPGVYDIFLGAGDGRSRHFQIEVAAS